MACFLDLVKGSVGGGAVGAKKAQFPVGYSSAALEPKA